MLWGQGPRLPCSSQHLQPSVWWLAHRRHSAAAAAAKSCQLCRTLCDPIDGSPPGSPVPGILQARTLEWACIYPRLCLSPSQFRLRCRTHKWSEVKVAQSRPTRWDSMDHTAHGILRARILVGSLSLLQGIFSTQGSNPGLLHCRWILYQLSHKGSHRTDSSVAQSCLTLCDPVDWSTPGVPVHHQLPELTQTHVHKVGDAIQPSHPLLSRSPSAFNLAQHQGLFQWVSSSHQVAKVLEFQLQHQSFRWIFGTDFL